MTQTSIFKSVPSAAKTIANSSSPQPQTQIYSESINSKHALETNNFKARLEVSNLSVGYGNQLIIKDVSFKIPDGKITVLVGPNGCGKSTLIKTMARVLTPSQGQVVLDQQSIHKTSSLYLAKKLALLPQGPIAPEGLSVRELVAQGRFPHQSLIKQWSATDQHAVDQAMIHADIIDLADRPISDMSGGQRQRVWIAMVLAQDTEFLLLDEPTTFLDMKIQVDVLIMLAKIAHQSQRTLVLVLHELNMAAAFADYMIMMKGGELKAQGTPHQIFTEDNLRKVFDLDTHIIIDPNTNCPVCLPLFNNYKNLA